MPVLHCKFMFINFVPMHFLAAVILILGHLVAGFKDGSSHMTIRSFRKYIDMKWRVLTGHDCWR